jgi:uncharacterized protein involved in outer membrane biogenesis
MRRKILLALAIVVAVPIAVLLLGALYLTLADASWYRGKVEEIVTEALGREFTIVGELELDILPEPSILAEKITLANPEWCNEPAMVQVGHLAVTLDLWSLISGPIRVRHLELRGARVWLLLDDEGRATWDFETDGQEQGAAPDEWIVFEEVEIDDLKVIYQRPAFDQRMELAIRSVDLHLGEEEMLELQVDGKLNDSPLEISGHVGTLESLYAGKDIEGDLSGHVGNVELALRGSVADVATLGGPDVEFEMSGPDFAAVARTLGLPSRKEGAFRLSGRTSSAPEGIDFELDAELGQARATVQGGVGTLLDLDEIDLEITASGPDLEGLGSLAGVEGIPPGHFSMAGRMQRRGPRLAFEQMEIRVGANKLSLDGLLGMPPRMLGSDLTFQLSGPNLSSFQTLSKIDLPPERFELGGRVVREEGIMVEADLRARVGEATLEFAGTIGGRPAFVGTDLEVHAVGPDLSAFEWLAGRELPGEPFEIEGRMAYRGSGIDVDSISARLGENDLFAEGTFIAAGQHVGTDLGLRAEGPDVSRIAGLGGLAGLPAEPYDVAGRVRILADGYVLDGVEAHVGVLELQADGHLGPLPDLLGSDLEIGLRGAALSALAPYGDLPPLPEEPFTVTGRMRIEKDLYRLDHLSAEIDDNRIAVDGTLARSKDRVGTDLVIGVSGPDLAALGRLLAEAGLAGWPGLPDLPYTVSGTVRLDEVGYALDQVDAEIGEIKLRLDGRAGAPPEFAGTDITFEAHGPDASVIAPLARLPVPAERFLVRGRLERQTSGVRFYDLVAELGDYRAEVNGMLGEPPKLVGTNLDLHVAGPSLELFEELADLPHLPEQPFEASGHFDGTPERFDLRRFAARVGPSDISGAFRIDLRDKPHLQAEFVSDHVDFREWLQEEGTEASEPPGADEAKDPGLLISDEPLPLDLLRSLDADVHWRVADLNTQALFGGGGRVDLQVRDGRLRLDPISAQGDHGGTMASTVTLEPSGEDYRLQIELRIEGARLILEQTEEDPKIWPTFDLDLEFDGVGRSPHAIMSSADGWLVIGFGSGRLTQSIVKLLLIRRLASDLLLDALNPFRKKAPSTDLDCFVLVGRLEDGVATIEPLAVRTDKMSALARGTIEFDSEKLDFNWTSKPRKGVGLTTSAITNPYIKVGGTLSRPSFDIKPLTAATATGAAFLTGGLSLLGKGLWDRVTAGRKVCRKALKRADRLFHELEQAREQEEARESAAATLE